MHNLLILYNPYYQTNVVEQHLAILCDKGRVAFGKVKSKLSDKEQDSALLKIYQQVNPDNPLQLFLSDYANLFVAKVVEVCNEACEEIIPDYYKTNQLEVESYFIVEDLRELVREDFSLVRDKFLANFTTSNGHTYAIYGNTYTYPLIVYQKREIPYFAEESKHYFSVFKSAEYLAMQENFIRYIFGKNLFYALHPDSAANLISAELELQQNGQNPLQDLTSVIVKYSKIIEFEVYHFAKEVLAKLCQRSPQLLEVRYSVQRCTYTLKDFFTQKPNLGSIKFIFTQKRIRESIGAESLRRFIEKDFVKGLELVQKVRNNAVHNKPGTLEDVNTMRNEVLGIEKMSLLKNILLYRNLA